MDQKTQYYPIDKSNELSLIELWKVLVKYKFLIIFFTIFTTIVAIYYALTLPAVYRAEVLMAPSVVNNSSGVNHNGIAAMVGESFVVSDGASGSAEESEAFARLKTRTFLINYIKENDIKPIIFSDQWNTVEKKWINKEPRDIDAFRLFSSMIEAGPHPKSRAKLSSLWITWKNPKSLDKIAAIANSLVESLNIQAKQRAIIDAENSILFLKKELEKTIILDFQVIIHSMIVEQKQIIMLANVKDDFIFEVIDPAITPDNMEDNRISVIIFIGIILGIFFGSFMAVSINFFKS